MPAAKKAFVVARPFDRVDPNTGAITHFEPGDPYSGPDTEKYLAWPDDFGPLITETTPDVSSDDRKGR